MAQHSQDDRNAAATARIATRRIRAGEENARRFVSWLRNEALPFWSDRGWDARRGGFHERMFFDGKADDLVMRRTRVQWRQIYVYAHAHELGWTAGLKIALKGLEHMIARAWAPDGAPGFVHVLNPDGSVSAGKRDAYDHAFAILALSWLSRASGDAQVRALLDRVMDFCEEALTDANGFLIEALPPELPRRQNPHMHMLEAMMAALETVNHPDAAARATRYRRMLERSFLDRETGLLVEFFDDDWNVITEEGAAVVEPGHMAEWVWLIRKYEKLLGQKASPLGTHLLGAALRAAEPQTGFLIDEIDTAQQVRRASRRLWPQTELIKAWLAQAETGADRAEEAADTLIGTLLATYLSGPFAGGWYDRYDAAGAIGIDTVPASTLYHIFVAAVEADRVLCA
ncbi:AGE family epimerase/isomerase [Rhabdaerophilum calidifontis]|uniref:AGE family epimerase/isomerase n=1 Tax=Rhabdaerophilum calidifontis TaxID=2604328 RepID=UPI00140A8776|nr:AGE family epimerase/isomerase [Rhabdaerophilum calidifontis]